MIVLREAEYTAVPWKNGGGMTREIVRQPVDAEAFDWRLSLAAIDAHGPFSPFPGYERTLVLVRGAGVELTFADGGSARLESAGQMASFDGAWYTTCTLIDGPSTDLNLIVSKERASAACRCERIASDEIVETGGWSEVLIACIAGGLRLVTRAGSQEELAPTDVARCTAADGELILRPQGNLETIAFVGALAHR